MHPMSDSQIDELRETLNEVNADNESIQALQEAKNKPIEELVDEADKEQKKVVAEINPTTGQVEGTSIAHGYGFDKDNTLFDDFLDDDDDDLKPADSPDTDFNFDQIGKAIKTTNIPITSEVSIEDIAKLRDVLIKKNTTGEIKYSDMPKVLQDEIHNKCAHEIGRGGMSSRHFNMARNMMANDIIEDIYTSVVQEELNEACIDLDTSIKNFSKKELGNAQIELNKKQFNTFVNEFPKLAAEKYEDEPEKANLLMGISEGFKQAHSLETMYERFCKGGKRMKLRNIDLDKPHKVIRDFEMKYKNSKYTVRNLRLAEDTLSRHVNQRFSKNAIRGLVIIFCRYTENMKPENVDEHTFMYYFINNILSLDLPVTDKDDVEYRDTFIDNLNHFLSAIEERLPS